MLPLGMFNWPAGRLPNSVLYFRVLRGNHIILADSFKLNTHPASLGKIGGGKVLAVYKHAGNIGLTFDAGGYSKRCA